MWWMTSTDMLAGSCGSQRLSEGSHVMDDVNRHARQVMWIATNTNTRGLELGGWMTWVQRGA